MLPLPLQVQEQDSLEIQEHIDYLYEWGGVVVFAVMGVFYFLPSIIALFRGKKNVIAIMALNFFLGCTVVGWVVSLVWSLSADAKPHTVVVNQNSPKPEGDHLERIAKLKKLFDDGAISEQEFIIEKNKLLKK